LGTIGLLAGRRVLVAAVARLGAAWPAFSARALSLIAPGINSVSPRSGSAGTTVTITGSGVRQDAGGPVRRGGAGLSAVTWPPGSVVMVFGTGFGRAGS
jgi:hypothetical protein